MPAPVRIWLEIAHRGAFRIGGWAFVRLRDGAVSGAAGGARRLDLERTALRAIAAALSALAPGEPVELRTSSPAALAIPGRIADAEAGDAPPTEDLELWAMAAAALRRPGLVVSPAIAAPRTPTAFTAAWADLACDRAKSKGEFTAPIPKHNLAKAGV
ncbi:MAG TPA: ribonuclease H [Caulobacteraceae bacterium]|nr:ribonuclease H [Caulobacteraceae bacterium]